MLFSHIFFLHFILKQLSHLPLQGGWDCTCTLMSYCEWNNLLAESKDTKYVYSQPGKEKFSILFCLPLYLTSVRTASTWPHSFYSLRTNTHACSEGGRGGGGGGSLCKLGGRPCRRTQHNHTRTHPFSTNVAKSQHKWPSNTQVTSKMTQIQKEHVRV